MPVFGALVLIAETAHLNPAHLAGLCIATFAARIGQSSIHALLPETNASVAVRFACLLVQLLTMTAMAVFIAIAALERSTP